MIIIFLKNTIIIKFSAFILVLCAQLCYHHPIPHYFRVEFIARPASPRHSGISGNSARVQNSSFNTAYIMNVKLKAPVQRKDVIYYFKQDMDGFVKWEIHDVEGDKFFYKQPQIGNKDMLLWFNEFDHCFTCFIDVYVSKCALPSNGTHIIDSRIRSGPAFIYNEHNGNVIAHVMNGICFGHGYLNFGHFIIDCLLPLMAMPEDYIKNSKIICSANKVFAADFYAVLGVLDNVIFVNPTQWVHCDSLISATDPMPHMMHFGPVCQRFSDIFRKKLNLTSIEPNRFAVVQRTNSRIISNIDDCIQALKAEIPDVNWECINDTGMDLQQYAKLHASLKIFGNVCGSNTHKSLFMKENSVVIFINTDGWDYSVYIPPASIGLKIVWFMHKGFKHGAKSFAVDVKRFVDAFKVGYTYVNTSKWPQPDPKVAFIDILENTNTK